MALSIRTLSSTASGSYGIINECIWDIKSLILSACPYASLISDNLEGGSAPRVVVIKIGNSGHYLKISATGTTSLSVYVLKTDGTTNSTEGFNVTNVNGGVFKVLAGDNAALFHFPGDIASCSICYIKSSDGNWYGGNRPTSAAGLFHYNLDGLVYYNTGFGSAYKSAGGSIGITKIMFNYAGQWIATANAFFSYSDAAMSTNNYYSDGVYTYAAFNGALLSDR